MDQQSLRELEKRCIQEEPPECTAACPIHVDARAFVGHVQSGAWERAWKVLRAIMPFPGILGRICDGPFLARCKRGQAGDPIQIHCLEAACVAHPAPRHRVMPLPSKGLSVAVAGSGLSSLTVAWDLSRKGYAVTLFEPTDRIGQTLISLAPSTLTREIIEGETAIFESLKVVVKTNARIDSKDFIDDCLNHFDALYLGLDAVDSDAWTLDRDAGGAIAVTPKLQATGTERVFAGGTQGDASVSPVWRCAQGRWAATSMDRMLQKVSMTAGREKEGPHATQLFTSMDNVEPAAMVVPKVGDRYSDEEAQQEAARCLTCECLECVKVCRYLESFGGYPKTYVREIYNNAAIVMGERKANRLINSCSLCGLCEAVCPNDFAVQELCLEARRDMVARGKMPPSAHDFALQDMAFANSDRFALARHAPGTTASSHLFFPGCQLCASSPRQVTQVYNYLREKMTGGVALMLGCCGAPAHWAGQETLFSEELARWEAQWIGLGRPKPIMACSTCLRVFTEHLPEAGAVSFWEVLETTGIPDRDVGLPNGPLAVHDPCTTRDVPAVQASVRRLLHCTGVSIEELTLGREKTECCGFGGLMQAANPELSREVADRRGKLSGSDFVAYCAMCRDNLAAVGKRTLHLLDLLFPDPKVADPAGRPRPGWSLRRENRLRLRAELCRSLWDEKSVDDRDDHETIELLMDTDVEALLDSRRILEDDIRRVIAHAQSDGSRFRHKESGHFLALFRPYHATFWVEYTPEGGGFRVHNAYAHRMEVLGP
ncbi:pyridine nucleotide-disulfide oxidoreductase/dicluster-binding protein [uncultured Desulfosarcina sp.]|uniref:pyridine nucleotide-disulfide oxidoreductase/dicluster-binding protein n=1 Tax=uncultured Desulfosarcina sp. TaxID=218289 RepID=UPI0029C682C4|nr:pyridine nucleotide-disulfide oxidoreductase/dicluster-binding protein [uncultured Desulfosarcina sp.]